MIARWLYALFHIFLNSFFASSCLNYFKYIYYSLVIIFFIYSLRFLPYNLIFTWQMQKWKILTCVPVRIMKIKSTTNSVSFGKHTGNSLHYKSPCVTGCGRYVSKVESRMACSQNEMTWIPFSVDFLKEVFEVFNPTRAILARLWTTRLL